MNANMNHTPVKPPCILVVKDNDMIQTVHKFILEPLGFEVDVVDKNQGAIDLPTMQEYTATVLDLGLPDISGEEVITTIRKREQTTDQHLPIIVNSAHAIQETLRGAREKGADIALLKPVNKENFKKTV